MPARVKYLALDITDIVIASLAMPGMLELYQYYPLKDMIYDILSSESCPGEIEMFYDNLLSIVPVPIDQNQEQIDRFIERLCFDLDTAVDSTLGLKYDSYTYSMKGWLNSNSILLEVKEYNANNSIDSSFDFGARF